MAHLSTDVAEPGPADFYALMKPRVMALVVFTALAGMLAAPVALHPVVALTAILCISVGAGAAGALNMWYDADIDARMRRTAARPVPAGRVTPQQAQSFGLALSAASVLMLGLATNWAAAALLAFTIFFYVVVYTMWLKRATPQNIVIGGLAGAFPPALGWMAATGALAVEPILLVALIFLWTPPHFWALALFVKSDYHDAGVPMLTVTHGRPATRRAILAYSLALAPASLAIAVTSIGGPIYAAVALVLNLHLIRAAAAIARRTDADGTGAEVAFFKFSLLYLFLHFAAVLAETARTALGLLPGWPVLV